MQTKHKITLKHYPWLGQKKSPAKKQVIDLNFMVNNLLETVAVTQRSRS